MKKLIVFTAVLVLALLGSTGIANAGNILLPEGNVGIGTTNPSRSLDVLGLSGEVYAQFRNPTPGTGSYGGLILERRSNSIGAGNGIGFDFGNADSVTRDIEYSYIGSELRVNEAGFECGDLVFLTTNAGNTRQERMRIQFDGNVGIGTTTPAADLDVVGETITDELTLTLAGTPATSDTVLLITPTGKVVDSNVSLAQVQNIDLSGILARLDALEAALANYVKKDELADGDFINHTHDKGSGSRMTSGPQF